MKKHLLIAAGFLLLLAGVSALFLQLPGETRAAGTSRYASPTGSSTSCTSASPCALQTALNAAVAGDEVIAKDGTYTGHYNVNVNPGTAASPILLKAENLHGAIIQGNSSPSDGTVNEYAFNVTKSYWIIEGFEMIKHRLPIITEMTGDHLEVRYNLIHDHFAHGFWLKGGNSYVHENVISQCVCTNTANSWAGVMLDQSSNHTVQKNIIYSITNNKFISTGGSYLTLGYPVLGALSNNNLIQGNVMMDGAKNTGLRFMTFSVIASARGPWSSGNMVRDNIMAHGQGGGIGFAENAINSTATNNLSYNLFFLGLGAKGNDPGNDVFTHNTVIMTNYSYMGTRLETNDETPGVPSYNSTFTDNLTYSSLNVPRQQLIYYIGGGLTTFHHNLWWSLETPSSGWFTGYTPPSTDVLQRPTFTDAANGDFSLIARSPGKNTASDGTDIGITYNTYLTKAMAQKVVSLPTQEWVNPGSNTSHAFSATDGHWYSVFAYVPDTGYWTGDETYSVNGQTGGTINIQNDAITGSGWIMEPPARYMYIGSWPSLGGQINVSWQHANAASKILIRQMPTPADAYTWISAVSATPTPTPTPSPLTSALLNAGGPSYTATDGTYAPDASFSGGSTFSNTKAIANTTDDTLYNTERYGNPFSYDIPLQNGNYNVTLKFAETYWTAPNMRIFSVSAEGTTVLSNIDIYASAGADTAYDRSFPVTISDGTLNLTFSASIENAKVNAIKVVPASSPISCHQYTPSTTIPTGYASPYDVVSFPTTNLMNATCDVSSARLDVGKNDPLQYIYNQGYLFKTGGTNWTPLSYTSSESLIANAWYPKSATANITLTTTELQNPSYNLAYICSWVGSAWKCGCRDSACTQSYWQIQSFKR